MAWPSGKAGACKAPIPQFESGCHLSPLQKYDSLSCRNSHRQSRGLFLSRLSVLKNCDYILCEDTRHSRILLEKYEIDRPLKSFHKFNEKKLENHVIEELRSGKQIALLSDAGTPLIADPGADLLNRCRQEGLEVTAIPGANAALTALILSGLPAQPFQFIGFLAKKEGEL